MSTQNADQENQSKTKSTKEQNTNPDDKEPLSLFTVSRIETRLRGRLTSLRQETQDQIPFKKASETEGDDQPAAGEVLKIHRRFDVS